MDWFLFFVTVIGSAVFVLGGVSLGAWWLSDRRFWQLSYNNDTYFRVIGCGWFTIIQRKFDAEVFNLRVRLNTR